MITPEELVARLEARKAAFDALPVAMTTAAKESISKVSAPGVAIGVSGTKSGCMVQVVSANKKVRARSVAKAIAPQMKRAVRRAIQGGLHA